MTPEAQRICIAEACGWRVEEIPGASWMLTSPDGRRWAGFSLKEIAWSANCIPDYLNDLNAMHEAEKVLVTGHGWKEKLFRYSSKLMTVMRDTDPGRIDVAFKHDMVHLRYFTLHGTAAQRAEAFLRTLNLWKD